MAIKYLCDGCDREIVSGYPQNVSVKIQVQGGSDTGGGYELCKFCVSNMISMADPKNWTRCIEALPAPRKLA